jgi:putative hydrolase of the HAD superfamily
MGEPIKCILFDWGNTIMRDIPEYRGPMYLWPDVAAMPGAIGVIAAVGRNRVVALATNATDSCEEHIWMALGRVSLDMFFNKVYCFQKIGHLKPSAEFFKHVLDDLHILPQQIIMVGDEFDKDILGANRCDIFGIWVNQESCERRIGRLYNTIYSLDELPNLIARHEMGTA